MGKEHVVQIKYDWMKSYFIQSYHLATISCAGFERIFISFAEVYQHRNK